MKYLSVCSGIEAATAAWRPLGWSAVAFAEIDRFPSAVLAHHYQHVPNYGDMTKFKDWPDAAFDVLVGGTPCQSFSVAGLRAGLADPRGNLALTYLAVLDRYRPTWCVFENVPGVLSADGGRAMGAFLGGLSELGYGWAYRSLDAQFFHLAQRRQRVFVVGHLGDWRRAAAVLFERESLSGHPAPRRETGQGLAPSVTSGPPFSRTGNERVESEAVVLTLEIRGRDGGCNLEYRQDGTANALRGSNGGRAGMGVGAIAFDARQSDVLQYGDQSGPLDTDWHSVAVAYGVHAEYSSAMTGGGTAQVAFRTERARALDTTGGYAHNQGGTLAQHGMQVRRLTPLECCRLQGFPDDYLDITYRGKPAADGPKYKALGNSMAVPVVRWLGERICMVDQLDRVRDFS